MSTSPATRNSVVTPADFPEIEWNGSWIWVPEDKIEPGPFLPDRPVELRSESHGLFRKKYFLKTVPARVPARITADSRYALYVNGQEVSRGPARSQPRRMLYDLFDLAPYLKAGENLVAVHVRYYGRPYSFYMPAVPNAGLGKTGALVFEANVGTGWWVSDGTWKATKCYAWEEETGERNEPVSGGVPVEILDASKHPAGWQDTEFKDGNWPCAQVLRAIHIGGTARSKPPCDPYGPLYPRPIGQLGGEVTLPVRIQVEYLQGAVDISKKRPAARIFANLAMPARPAAVTGSFPVDLEVSAGSPARLAVDMGRVVAGLFQMDVTAPAGTVFDLMYVEDPPTGKEQGFGVPHNGSRYIARGSNDAFETFDPNGMRNIYILVHGASGPVTIDRVAVREMIYPWQPGASFECSDPELNRLFQAGIRTVNLNSQDLLWTARPASSAPGWATALCIKWYTWRPTSTGAWPGST